MSVLNDCLFTIRRSLLKIFEHIGRVYKVGVLIDCLFSGLWVLFWRRQSSDIGSGWQLEKRGADSILYNFEYLLLHTFLY
jgi:hypothetical protein